MKNNYLCPKCRSLLKVAGYIVFSAKTRDGETGLLLLNPTIGDYSVVKNPLFSVKEGEHIDILCPVCHANLVAADIHKNLAKIIMVDEKHKEYTIYFSEIVGEKCTYKVKKDILEAYGDDQDHYVNYFGVFPQY